MREKLKELRIKKGYKTHKEFSEALSISVSTYRSIEQGKTFPRENLLFKILRLLSTKDISIMEDKEKAYKRGDINKNICRLMNDQSTNNFTIYDIYVIRKSINEELEDRKLNCINIKHNDDGKRAIYRRIAYIANKNYGLNICYQDVKLFKQCVREEYQERTGKSTWSIPNARQALGFDPNTGRKIDI